MKLVPNSGDVLRKSWSVRLMALSGGCQTLAYCWPSGIAWLPDWFQLVPLALLALALLARFIAQRGLTLSDDDEAQP